MERLVMHVDMDAFFASIEQRDHEEYRGKPLIVGGLSGRGVVSTCSYEARRFGVHSAMPIVRARRLCPQGIFVEGDYAHYKAVSQEIFAIFARYAPVVEPLSIDGPSVSIRKFRQEAWGMDDLVRMGSLDAAMSSLLHHAVRERCNILISGGTGTGKTTLLKLMLGGLVPTEGTVEEGTRIDVAYFDQLRHQLDLEKTVIDNVAEGRDFIDIDGQSRHVLSYLGDFLFSPQRARTPVKALSGGERARLLLAKLFSKPANLLVLDEPTNDLDVETLELLEEVLLTFKGTVLMVSHDRAFLDNVVTSTLVFEEIGRAHV